MDAWQDAKERCVVTKADEEWEDAINQDFHLSFLEMEVSQF